MLIFFESMNLLTFLITCCPTGRFFSPFLNSGNSYPLSVPAEVVWRLDIFLPCSHQLLSNVVIKFTPCLIANICFRIIFLSVLQIALFRDLGAPGQRQFDMLLDRKEFPSSFTQERNPTVWIILVSSTFSFFWLACSCCFDYAAGFYALTYNNIRFTQPL